MPKKKTQTEAEWAEMVDKLMTEFVARRSGLDHVERRRIRDRIQDLTLSEKIDMTPQDTRLMLNDIIVDAAKADVVEAKADVVKAKEKWKAEDAAAAKAKEKRFSLKPAESVCGRVRLRRLPADSPLASAHKVREPAAGLGPPTMEAARSARPAGLTSGRAVLRSLSIPRRF